MTRGVISVTPDMPLRRAAEMMLQYKLSGFPVLEMGRLVGMLTEGDFMRRVETGTERRRGRCAELLVGYGQLAAEYVQAHGRTVGEVMTRDIVTIADDAPLDEAVELMRRHDIKRLPVVTDAGMVGIVSRVDLLHAYVAAARQRPDLATGDDAIREGLEAELRGRAWAPGRSFRLEVKDAVVDLYGLVWDERQCAALRVAAENIDGVKQVRDHMTVADITLRA
jgi:CBS domain-containing protein